MAKSEILKNERTTTPQAELKAVLKGAQLWKKLRGTFRFPVRDVVLWTDNLPVIYWIQTETKRPPAYVGTIKTSILKVIEPHQLRYVPTALNVADDISRGISPEKFNSEHRALTGPPFLLRPKSEWPAQPFVLLGETELFVNQSVERTNEAGEFIDRFSSLDELKRAVAERVAGDVSSRSAKELQQALQICIKATQERHFAEEIKALSTRMKISRSSRLLNLTPFLDSDGVLRVGGRLCNADALSENAKNPIILPTESKLTELLIKHTHESLMHGSTSRTHFDVRACYWILRGKQRVKRVLANCEECRRRKKRPEEALMASLPRARVAAYEPVWQHTGVDAFGPLTVTIGRKTDKRYGLLFVCMTTRGIHIELMDKMDSDSTIMAFRRFFNLRGRAQHIYSDNGSNFIAAERELKEGWGRVKNDESFKDFLAGVEATWHFNPADAPHFGGSWERLVRTVKEPMRAALGNRTVNEEVLRTVLAEVNGLVNGRPLTELGTDQDDPRPLTPNHFIMLRENRNTPPDVLETCVTTLDRRRWKASQQLVDLVWRRFLKEYLPQLMKRPKWMSVHRNLQVGDTVLIADRLAPRGLWLTGQVVEVFPGVDQTVRSVEVAVGNKRYRRPIHHLVILKTVEENQGQIHA